MLSLLLYLTSTSLPLALRERRLPMVTLYTNKKKEFSVPSPTQAELSTFFHDLSKIGKPALLSIMPEYSDAYVLDYGVLSVPISALFTEECMALS